MQPRDKFFTALLDVRMALPRNSESVEVVSAGTKLNAESVDTLRSKLVACAQKGSWRYVVDLSRVKMIDSSGLGMLVAALRNVQDAGGAVGLVTDSPKFQRILELCAHTRACKIYARTGDALRALRTVRQPRTAA